MIVTTTEGVREVEMVTALDDEVQVVQRNEDETTDDIRPEDEASHDHANGIVIGVPHLIAEDDRQLPPAEEYPTSMIDIPPLEMNTAQPIQLDLGPALTIVPSANKIDV